MTRLTETVKQRISLKHACRQLSSLHCHVEHHSLLHAQKGRNHLVRMITPAMEVVSTGGMRKVCSQCEVVPPRQAVVVLQTTLLHLLRWLAAANPRSTMDVYRGTPITPNLKSWQRLRPGTQGGVLCSWCLH